MKKTISLVISMLMLMISLVACTKDEPEVKNYTVTFNSNGGSEVEKQSVAEGGKVTKPTDPTYDGYIFDAWYSDSALTDAWDFASDTVSSDITLYAKWNEEAFNGYEVKVVYEDGTPVTGAVIQWCTPAGVCSVLTPVDADGIARSTTLSGTQYVHINENTIPEGYTYDINLYVATEENKSVTIELIKLSSATSGDGTKATPYVVGLGAYNVSVTEEANVVYYSFTPTEAGTYVFESHKQSELATEPFDPLFAYYSDKDYSDRIAYADDGGDKENFKYEIEVSEDDVNKPIYFRIQESSGSNSEFPNEFYFDILKK